MSATSTMPGEGLSFTDLCNAGHDSEVRLMWRALGALAAVLGIETTAPGIGARSKTVDELLADIRAVAPASLDIAGAAKATLALTPDPPKWTEVYEVRQLLADGDGVLDWYREDDFEDYPSAVAKRESLEGQNPESIYVVTKTLTTTKTEVYPKGYQPRW